MKVTILFLISFLIVESSYSQNTITLKFENNTWTSNQDTLDNADPAKQTNIKIEGCTGISNENIELAIGSSRINSVASGSEFTFEPIPESKRNEEIKISVKCNEISKEFSIFNKYRSTNNNVTKISADEYFNKNDKTKNIYSRNIRYAGNKAYIFLDENGKYLGKLPVNLDEDDIIYLYMAVKKSEKNDYQIDITEGEYSPVDLQILPGQDIKTQSSLPREEWDLIPVIYGPFTSDYFAFSVKKKKGENLVTISSYKIKINNLYHLQIGASFVATYLRMPEYKISPLTDTTNTIIDVSNNSRTLITVNVIWYLEPMLKYLFGGSKLMRGRDVLKEPTFLQRINPAFGVSLSENIAENFFFGLTLEFARGGNIIGGGHYGKTLQLADEKFELGKTQFNGQQDKIITKDKYEWKWFFGVTLDSRVFNKLFTGGGG